MLDLLRESYLPPQIQRQLREAAEGRPIPSYTCPDCRQEVMSKPIEFLALKSVAQSFAVASQEPIPHLPDYSWHQLFGWAFENIFSHSPCVGHTNQVPFCLWPLFAHPLMYDFRARVTSRSLRTRTCSFNHLRCNAITCSEHCLKKFRLLSHLHLYPQAYHRYDDQHLQCSPGRLKLEEFTRTAPESIMSSSSANMCLRHSCKAPHP